MTTLATLSALWVSTRSWHLSAVRAKTDPVCFTESYSWRTPPTWDDPARLVRWAASVATSAEQFPPRLGKSFKFRRPQDADQVTRFALLLSPTACAAFGVPAMPDTAHPWTPLLEAAGWKVRTRTPGPWLTVERPGVEIGILMVGWLDKTKPRELATHGIVVDHTGRIDSWGSVYVHGEYRRLTGWPLSAGAGMAAIKGLWRYPRAERVRWAPDEDYWATVPPVAEGRAQRPWHVHWTSWTRSAGRAGGRVVLWDANAAYLNAWAAARFARELLAHTGPDPIPGPGGRYDAGYFLITPLQWSPACRPVAERLPPVYGSRTPDSQGNVWVTHEILDLIASLNYGPDGQPPRYRILDSWTCANYGQLAKPWGSKLKAALTAARREDYDSNDPETAVLVAALKAGYARGYPLLATAGFMRRPDHVDTVVDRSNAGAYRKMWTAAWNGGHYPLDVSADEITYPAPGDNDIDGPLGPNDPFAFGGYKSKHTGTAAEWHQAHQDGRNGRWWLPAPEPVAPAPTAAVPAPDAPPRPGTGDEIDDLFD